MSGPIMVEIWVYLNLNENSIEIHVGKDLPTKPPLGFTIKFLLSGLRHGPNYLRPVTDFWHNNHNSPYLEWIEIEKVAPSTILGQSPLTTWGLIKNVFLQNHPGWRFSSADLEIRNKIVFLTKGKPTKKQLLDRPLQANLWNQPVKSPTFIRGIKWC